MALALLSFLPACKGLDKASDVLPLETVHVGEKTRPTITVFNNYGSVYIQAFRSLPPRVQGQMMRVAFAKGRAAASRLLKRIDVRREVDGAHYKIVVTAPSRAGKVEASVNLQVPVESDVTVVTTIGNVRVDGVRGRVEVEGTKGNVNLRGMNGFVKVIHKSGKVEVSGFLKGAEVVNGSGDVKVRWRGPEKLEDDSVIRTKKGSLDVRLASSINALLNVEAPAGKIVSTIPLKHSGKGFSRAALNNGGKLLLLGAKGGTVRIISYEAIKAVKIPIKGPPQLRGGRPPEPPRPSRDASVTPLKPTRGARPPTARKARPRR